MPDGAKKLEDTINRFEELLEEMRSEIREGNATLKQLRNERREIERLLTKDVKKTFEDAIDGVIKKELDILGPEMRRQTHLIYDRVNSEVDKILNICLGKEFSASHNNKDLRPQLAEKLRNWLYEILAEGRDA